MISKCGFATFAATEVTKTITFLIAEVDADYLVFTSPGAGAGSPIPVSSWWHTKTVNGFDIDISGDPDVGNTVIVDWIVVRCV